MSYLHSQQNCHQLVYHHVPGPQDDRLSIDMARAAAPGVVELVTEILLACHGLHWESLRPCSWSDPQRLFDQQLNPNSSVTVSKTK